MPNLSKWTFCHTYTVILNFSVRKLFNKQDIYTPVSMQGSLLCPKMKPKTSLLSLIRHENEQCGSTSYIQSWRYFGDKPVNLVQQCISSEWANLERIPAKHSATDGCRGDSEVLLPGEKREKRQSRQKPPHAFPSHCWPCKTDKNVSVYYYWYW
jgi:hypothetical protein